MTVPVPGILFSGLLRGKAALQARTGAVGSPSVPECTRPHALASTQQSTGNYVFLRQRAQKDTGTIFLNDNTMGHWKYVMNYRNFIACLVALNALSWGWYAEGTVPEMNSPRPGCSVNAILPTAEDLHARVMGGDGLDPVPPVNPAPRDCKRDCKWRDKQPEYHCESRGSDCDGFWGRNESYRWSRSKDIYDCGAFGWYVECSGWVRHGCCNNGVQALPPQECQHSGAKPCPASIVLPQ
jgi:hypothetical protein